MARKGNYIYVKLESTGINPKTGKKTGHYYVTTKNPKSQNTTEKLTRNAYDPVTMKHEKYVEKKIK